MQRTAKIGLNPRARFWYLEVPDEVRVPLAAEARKLARAAGGVADDADHVTLCFVPKSDAPLGDDEVDAAIEAVAHNMAPREPIEVWIGGLAYFDTARGPDNEPATALVALIDGPGLVYLHAGTAYALRDHGWEWQDSHTFTAHCTLAYLPVGGRVPRLPVIEARWTVDHVCFANAEIHRIPIGGERMAKAAVLTREDLGMAVGEASMCWEYPERAGIFDSTHAADIVDRLERKMLEPTHGSRSLPMSVLADLNGEEMRRWRTDPDVGNGRLFTYCGDCVHVARSPITGVRGCTKGDDADVVGYGQRLDRGETSEDAERCPLFSPKDDEDVAGGEVGTVLTGRRVVARRRIVRADVQAGMTKEVPGETVQTAPTTPDDDAVEPLFDDDAEVQDTGDLDDLYDYLGVVGVDPHAASHAALPDVARGVATWRGGLLSDAIAGNPDFVRRIWEGYAARGRGAPPGAYEVQPDGGYEIDPDHYTWRTQHDEKVRRSHRWRDGKTFAWADPPPGGHPGQAPGCRCVSESILEIPGATPPLVSTSSLGVRVCSRCGLPRR